MNILMSEPMTRIDEPRLVRLRGQAPRVILAARDICGIKTRRFLRRISVLLRPPAKLDGCPSQVVLVGLCSRHDGCNLLNCCASLEDALLS